MLPVAHPGISDGMEQILLGVWHWTAFRDTIGADVHSYWHEPSGTVLDPMVPLEGLEAFDGRRVERLVLTNRHHYRQADAYRERFGCEVRAHEAGLHDLPGHVEGFAFGDELAPGVHALEVGVLCPEETAVHLDGGGGALAFADSVVRGRHGELGFVQDALLGDDAAAIKDGLRHAFARLARAQDFEALLMAHGEPLRNAGRSALLTFAEAPTAGAPPG
jgi:hypothetical protein